MDQGKETPDHDEKISKYQSEYLRKIFADPDANEVESDDKAQKEEDALDLTPDQQRDDHKKQVWHTIFIWGLWIFAVCLGIMFVVRILHIILPARFCWLTDAQISSLNEIVFSGLVGTLLGKQMKQIIPD